MFDNKGKSCSDHSFETPKIISNKSSAFWLRRFGANREHEVQDKVVFSSSSRTLASKNPTLFRVNGSADGKGRSRSL
jgi:hypothetical protein